VLQIVHRHLWFRPEILRDDAFIGLRAVVDDGPNQLNVAVVTSTDHASSTSRPGISIYAGRLSSGLIWMNMEERQHAVQAPQGTAVPPFPDRNEASAPRSHLEKLPAGSSSLPECTSLIVLITWF
jgi:hypothetical protein